MTAGVARQTFYMEEDAQESTVEFERQDNAEQDAENDQESKRSKIEKDTNTHDESFKVPENIVL